VLLVDHHQPELRVLDLLLDQAVSPHDEENLSRSQFGEQSLSGLALDRGSQVPGLQPRAGEQF
jgi:hypothetical protein